MVTGYIYAAGTSQVSLTGTENTVGNYVQASGDSQIQMDGTINTVKAGVWSNGSSSKVILSATDTNRVQNANNLDKAVYASGGGTIDLTDRKSVV